MGGGMAFGARGTLPLATLPCRIVCLFAAVPIYACFMDAVDVYSWGHLHQGGAGVY